MANIQAKIWQKYCKNVTKVLQNYNKTLANIWHFYLTRGTYYGIFHLIGPIFGSRKDIIMEDGLKSIKTVADDSSSPPRFAVDPVELAKVTSEPQAVPVQDVTAQAAAAAAVPPVDWDDVERRLALREHTTRVKLPVALRISPEVARAFAMKCRENGVFQSRLVELMMAAYVQGTLEHRASTGSFAIIPKYPDRIPSHITGIKEDE